MDIIHNGVKVADLEDFGLWYTGTAPTEPMFVLVTLQADGERWVEPGWYGGEMFLDDLGECFRDIHRNVFEEEVVAWMPFPGPFDR